MTDQAVAKAGEGVEAVAERMPTLAERFWARVKKGSPDECWPWTGSFHGKDYGQLWVRGANTTAHRVSWELANGPIPDGLEICHTCDNRPCVNPAHLFVGTRHDNMRDCAAKGRLRGVVLREPPTHCKRGHEFTPENTIRRAAHERGKRRCRTCTRAIERRSSRRRTARRRAAR